jgi:hypothetical protein
MIGRSRRSERREKIMERQLALIDSVRHKRLLWRRLGPSIFFCTFSAKSWDERRCLIAKPSPRQQDSDLMDGTSLQESRRCGMDPDDLCCLLGQLDEPLQEFAGWFVGKAAAPAVVEELGCRLLAQAAGLPGNPTELEVAIFRTLAQIIREELTGE